MPINKTTGHLLADHPFINMLKAGLFVLFFPGLLVSLEAAGQAIAAPVSIRINLHRLQTIELDENWQLLSDHQQSVTSAWVAHPPYRQSDRKNGGPPQRDLTVTSDERKPVQTDAYLLYTVISR